MRFPGEILQDRFKEQLLRVDLSKFPTPPVVEENDLGNTIKEMFANKKLTKMWIDRNTHEVCVE